MAKMAVIGGGAWGTALACHAARLGHGVTLWAHEPEVVQEVNARHRNSLYLPDAGGPFCATAPEITNTDTALAAATSASQRMAFRRLVIAPPEMCRAAAAVPLREQRE